jgi:hypothetical protein
MGKQSAVVGAHGLMLPLLAALAITCGVPATAQQAGAAGDNVARIELRLDRLEKSTWKEVDPATVFHQGERLRFRFSANFNGYLYVMNQGASGDYELLFPRQDTGIDNRVEAGETYIVPATKGGSFRVAGPPGYDVMHWMVTPLSLRGAGPKNGFVPLPPSGELPKSMTPRCDDSLWRARGECIDSDAGAKGVEQDSSLPQNLQGIPRADARDLLFIQKDKVAVVSSLSGLTAPVIYEFRLAHK